MKTPTLKVLKVGLTGGIGSGKTTVAKIFEVLGVPVYYADNAAKKIMNENATVRQQVIQHFGEAMYKNGVLDRQALSALVFNTSEKLALLNSIVHPATIADADAWMKQQSAPYIIKEAALLFESNAWKHVDYIIGVSAPLPLRLQRTMVRDNISKDAVQARINKQMDEREKMQRCNVIIMNDDETLLLPQVIKLHQDFIDRQTNR